LSCAAAIASCFGSPTDRKARATSPILVAENGSLAKPLRDAAYFARAFTEDGSGLAWPNGLDLDAVALHDEMKAAGLLGLPAA
jgi:hypothetical protein